MDTIRHYPYDIETYRILAVAGFRSRKNGLDGLCRIYPAGPESIQKALKTLTPSITILIPKEYCPAGYIEFRPVCIDDFDPSSMLMSQSYLLSLKEALDITSTAERNGLAHCEVEERLRTLLPGLQLDFSKPGKERAVSLPAAQRDETAGAIDDLLSLVELGGDGHSSPTPETDSFRGLQMQLEGIIRQVVRQIINDPGFRALEAPWRGAARLLSAAGAISGDGRVEILLVSAEGDELSGLLRQLQELEASKLPNLILLDFNVENTPKGMELLENIIMTADRLMIPVGASITPDFFGIAEWKNIGKLSYIKSFLEQPQYARWRKLRSIEGADWTMLFLNRFPARPLHSGMDIGKERIELKEKKQPWLSPVWGYGALAAMSAATTGWPMDAENYRRFTLEAIPYQDEEPIPLEMLIPEDRINQFLESGFSPFSARKRDDAIFLTGLSAINGNPAGFQIFFGMLVAFLIRLQESTEPGNSDIAAMVRNQLEGLLTREGYSCPDDLEVSRSYDAENGADIMNIAFTPPP